MSGGQACKCSERHEPISAPDTASRSGRLWRVLQYRCNHSAFSGYHQTPSAYSSVQCLRCGSVWRTKAPYADSLKHRADDERDITPGNEAHASAMEARGRTPYR